MPQLFEHILAQLQALSRPAALFQLVVLAAAILCAIWIGRRIRLTEQAKLLISRVGLRHRLLEALVIVSPHVAALVLTAAIGGIMHAIRVPTEIVDSAISLIALLLLVRVLVYVFRVSVGDRAPIKGWGNTISLLIWLVLALHTLDWFEPLVQALDSIGIKAGSSRITVWSVVKLLFTVSAFVVAAVWMARWLERRLMAMTAVAISMRIGLAKFIQAILVGLSILLGLNTAGLDLTTLNVLTGAIGIGLGFGLQAIASNFVSGFVLLMDRSIKPGDVISFTGVSGTSTEGFGWVQELRGRYVVVRDRDGVETLVPNQHLITNSVINWSYTDPRVRLKLPVRVSFDCDPETALAVLEKAADGHRRILRDPPPVSRLMGFGEYGFEMELRFWISDPQEGVNNVRSDINRSIWRLFKQHHIRVPIPQQDVTLRPGTQLPGFGPAADD